MRRYKKNNKIRIISYKIKNKLYHLATNLLDKEKYKVDYFKNAGKTYINVKEPVELKHEEHKTIIVQPGSYEIDQVKEYDPLPTLEVESTTVLLDKSTNCKLMVPPADPDIVPDIVYVML